MKMKVLHMNKTKPHTAIRKRRGNNNADIRFVFGPPAQQVQHTSTKKGRVQDVPTNCYYTKNYRGGCVVG